MSQNEQFIFQHLHRIIHVVPPNNVIKKQQTSFFSSVWVFQWIWFSPLSVLLHQSQWMLQRQLKYQRLAGWHQRDCLAGLLLLHQTVAAMICVATNQDWKSSAAASKDTVGQVPQVYLSSPTMQSSFWHKTIRNKLLLYKYIHCRLAVYKQGKPNRSHTTDFHEPPKQSILQQQQNHTALTHKFVLDFCHPIKTSLVNQINGLEYKKTNT